MDYEVIFDISDAGYKHWPLVALGLLFVGVGVLLVKHQRALPAALRRSPLAQRVSVFPYAVLGIALAGTTVMFVLTGFDYLSLRSEVRGGHADVVEGRVQDFLPGVGHDLERFTVCGVPFSYADEVVTAGFNQTRSHGGRIRSGLWVRIAYVDSDIVRLEIAIDDPGEKAECRRSSGLTGR